MSLVEGPNELTALAEDDFGHSSESNAVTYVLDTTAPVVVITEPIDGAILASDTVIVRGTIEELHLQSVVVNGVNAAVADGVFEAELQLPEGSGTITAVATDRVDLMGEATITVMRDGFPPNVTLLEPAASCVPAGQLWTVSGTLSEANPASGVGGEPPPLVLTVETSDGVTTTHLPVLAANGRTWSIDGVALGDGDGTAQLAVVATDQAGRTGRATRNLRVDATAPSITLFADNSALPTLTGDTPPPGSEPALTARAHALRVSISDPGGAAPQPTMTLDGAPWTSGAVLEVEGDHLLVARATDCGGHETVVHSLVRLDLTPPQLLDTNPADGALLGAGPDAFAGTSDPDLASASVAGQPAAVNDGAFDLSPVAWREGLNTIAIELEDLAGHRSSFEVSFTVDVAAPEVRILESGLPIPPGSVFLRGITPEVRVSDPDASLEVTLDGLPYTLGTVIEEQGEHTLAATATDALDRTGSASAAFAIDLSDGPTVAITSPTDGATLTEAVIDVTGTVTGTAVSVEVNGVQGTVTGGTWIVASLPLEPGTMNTITALATDASDRMHSASIQVMVRTEGPQILIVEPADGSATARGRIDVAGGAGRLERDRRRARNHRDRNRRSGDLSGGERRCLQSVRRAIGSGCQPADRLCHGSPGPARLRDRHCHLGSRTAFRCDPH